MKKIFKSAAVFILSALICMPLTAQENDFKDEPQKEDLVEYVYQMNQKGDQYIKVAISAMNPIGFGNMFEGTAKMYTGGMGSLGYHYFIKPWLIAGADIGFGFCTTIGKHIFNYIPFVATLTYQPTFRQFEFPITVGLGFATETYINYKYFPGLVLKGEVGAYWRINASWSVGADVTYLFMPQFAQLYDKEAHNILGQFVGGTIGARYHF